MFPHNSVIPGGQHMGGMTANALVVSMYKQPIALLITLRTIDVQIFQDGVYFELVCFTQEPSSYPPSSPERHKRETHPWATAPPGWLSYALLGTSTVERSISAVINARAQREGSDVVYNPEVSMGRVRPDGRALQFLLSVPDARHGLNVLPFFCGDVTPREWRVCAYYLVF